jgi:acyl-CoA hydrolase
MNTQIKFTTAAEAVKVIKSGDHIHLSSVASAPQCLIKAMCERGANHEFKDVHIHHLHTGERPVKAAHLFFTPAVLP